MFDTITITGTDLECSKLNKSSLVSNELQRKTEIENILPVSCYESYDGESNANKN